MERQRAHGPANPTVADLGTELLNLADIYRDQRRYGDADSLYRRAIQVLQRSLPEDALILDAFDSYATLLRRAGNVAAADSLDAERTALAVSRSESSETSPTDQAARLAIKPARHRRFAAHRTTPARWRSRRSARRQHRLTIALRSRRACRTTTGRHHWISGRRDSSRSSTGRVPGQV